MGKKNDRRFVPVLVFLYISAVSPLSRTMGMSVEDRLFVKLQ